MYKNYKLQELENKIKQIGIRPIDVLLVGATGVGKSSTLNSLFGDNLAKVGEGVNPETMLVNSYSLNDYLRFWDSPGLGDGRESDQQHAKKLTDTLCKTYENSGNKWGFIDLVLVILDGSIRDMGTTYRLLEQVILKNIQKNRVIVAINQADMAMKGRHWDYSNNRPKQTLEDFLEEKSKSVVKRIHEATNLTIQRPVYYSATSDYNLEKLMTRIIEHVPNEKRKLEI